MYAFSKLVTVLSAKTARRTILGLLSLPLLSCAGPGAGEVYEFRGRLLKEPVDAAILEIGQNPAIETISITSVGGDARHALRLAALVQRRKLRVVVEKYCFSACSQYVLLASPDRMVSPGSLVTFHHTMGLLADVHAESGILERSPDFKAAVAAEAGFYQSLPVPTDMARLAWIGLEPICKFERPRREPSDGERYAFVSAYPSFALSRTAVARAGLGEIKGYWPETEREMRAVLATLPFKKTFKVSWLDERQVEQAQALSDTPVVRDCI